MTPTFLRASFYRSSYNSREDFEAYLRAVAVVTTPYRLSRARLYPFLYNMSRSAPANRPSTPSPADFDRFLPHITSLFDKLTTHAASLPPKSDLAFHRTLDRSFARGLDSTSERVLALTEKLLSVLEVDVAGKGKDKGKEKERGTVASGSGARGKGRRKLLEEEDVVDGFRRGVVEVVDGLLEDAVSRSSSMSSFSVE